MCPDLSSSVTVLELHGETASLRISLYFKKISKEVKASSTGSCTAPLWISLPRREEASPDSDLAPLRGNKIIQSCAGCCVKDPVGYFIQVETQSSFITFDVMPYHNGILQQTFHLLHCFIIRDAIAVIFPCNPSVELPYVNRLITNQLWSNYILK